MLTSTSITSVEVAGNVATIKGNGTLNGTAGYRFEAELTDNTNSPDFFQITIYTSNGTPVHSAGPTSTSGGNLTVEVLGG